MARPSLALRLRMVLAWLHEYAAAFFGMATKEGDVPDGISLLSKTRRRQVSLHSARTLLVTETDYQRAWRERGEVEAALRKWHSNQSSPAFTYGVAVLAAFASLGMAVGFIEDPSWATAPAIFFVAMFGALPILTPKVLRDEAKARGEAKATLERLGVWEQSPTLSSKL